MIDSMSPRKKRKQKTFRSKCSRCGKVVLVEGRH